MTIEFRDIEGFEGYFEISNTGIIRNRNTGRIYKQAVSEWGYACQMLQGKYVRGRVYTHKAVATAFIPNTDNKPQVNHINGNKDRKSVV